MLTTRQKRVFTSILAFAYLCLGIVRIIVLLLPTFPDEDIEE